MFRLEMADPKQTLEQQNWTLVSVFPLSLSATVASEEQATQPFGATSEVLCYSPPSERTSLGAGGTARLVTSYLADLIFRP